MTYTAKSDSGGTESEFTGRKEIIITTGGTNTPTDYQVKITVPFDTRMQADFDDIRFNTAAGVYIDYWIESKTDSSTADVWVELPDAITDPGTDTIVMYFGNSDLSDGGSGADTFLQWHGATTSEFLEALDIVPSEIVFEALITAPTNASNYGISSLQDFLTNSIGIWDGGVQVLAPCVFKDGGVEYVIATELTAGKRNLKWTLLSGSVIAYVDGIEQGTISTGIPTVNMGLAGQGYAFDNLDQDWSFIRKGIANEPSAAIADAEFFTITMTETPEYTVTMAETGNGT